MPLYKKRHFHEVLMMCSKSYMKTFILVVVILARASAAPAQMVLLMNPETGKVFEVSRYADMNGSPFFQEEWIQGDVQVVSGKYSGLYLKYDAYDQKLYFEKQGLAYAFREPVIAFTLMPTTGDSSTYKHFIKGLVAEGLRPDQFLQVLVEGKLTLYRSAVKLLADVNEINRGVVKTFTTSIRYYLRNKEGMQLVKLSEKALLPFLSEQAEAVKAYISKNSLNLKQEKDVIALLRYANQ